MAAKPQPWWENRRWQFVACLLLALPLLWPDVPPLTDLPGHLGRYAIQLDAEGTPSLAANYQFRWALIGNLGVDLLVQIFAPVFGLELATKLIVAAIPVLTGFGLFAIARELHGRVPPTTWFALPLALGHPFLFGFVNFSLAIALTLNAFALWLRMGSGRWRNFAFLAASLLIWLVHGFGWGVLGLLCFAAEMARSRNLAEHGMKALSAALGNCLCLTPPLLLMLIWRSGEVSGGTGDWFNLHWKWQWLLMSLRDRWQWFDLLSLAVILSVIGWSIASSKTRFARAGAFAAALLAAAYVLLPRVLLGSAYADMRLAPFMLAMGLLAIRPIDTRRSQWLALAAMAFFIVRIGATSASTLIIHQRQTAALGAMDHLPKGARVASFVGMACTAQWNSDRLEHLPSLAIVRRQAFTNDQWAMSGAQPLRVTKADAPSFVEDPSQLVTDDTCHRPDWRTLNRALAELPRAAFEHIWLINPPAFDHQRLTDTTLIWSNPQGDALYRIDRAGRGDSAQSRAK